MEKASDQNPNEQTDQKSDELTGSKTAHQTDRKGKRTTFLLVLIAVAGVLIFTYPKIADYWNSFHQTRAIMNYSAQVAEIDPDEYERWIGDAREYNRTLAKTGFDWTLQGSEQANYTTMLDISGTGIMGYITIEKIDVMLPVYHGTQESVLQTSIGHLEATSLPVGAASYDKKEKQVTDPEDGSHCVLSGHRGLPSAKLFSDLDKLVEGDIFSLHILDETLTYEVDQVRIVEPTDLSELQLVSGMDYCTLVTCTPYGINTHRLLVRGHRVASPNGDMDVIADAMQIKSTYVATFIGVPIAVCLFILVMIGTRYPGGNRILRYIRRLIEKRFLKPEDIPAREGAMEESHEKNEAK